MDRQLCNAIPLATAFALAGLATAGAHQDTPISAGYGTPVIDGARGAGEWDDVVPRPVFTGLTGSLLYVLNDDTNLYLALWTPDPTLGVNDQFRVRIDDEHDGLSMDGEDELGATGTGLFFDLHFLGGLWNQGDAFFDGDGEAGSVDGGSFYEMSHPLDSGDVYDMSVVPGDTIGLCVRYNHDGGASTLNVYPPDCMVSLNQQSLYVDVATSTGTVGAPAGSLSGRALAAYPNPAELGSALEIRYAVPAGGADVRITLHAINGATIAEIASRRVSEGPQSVRWSVPRAGAAGVAPGVYFLRARYDGGRSETSTLILR